MTSQGNFKIVPLYSVVNYKEKHIFCGDLKTNRDDIIALTVHMYIGIANMPLQIALNYVIDDVIRSQYKSKFNCINSVNI